MVGVTKCCLMTARFVSMTALAIHTLTWVTLWFGRMAENLQNLETLQLTPITQTESEQAKW